MNRTFMPKDYTVPPTSAENDKFGFTGGTTVEKGRLVWEIVALKDMVDPITKMKMKKGAKGGYIEKEGNLGFKDDDTSWVFPGCSVMGEASVTGNSAVCCHTETDSHFRRYRTGCVVSDVKLIGNVRVYGVDLSTPMTITGDACIRRRSSRVEGLIRVRDKPFTIDSAMVDYGLSSRYQ